ncbi:hypothetical protein MKL29_08605 [Streptococcus suis]|nr:hypothetical protein [Streptococcus suis]
MLKAYIVNPSNGQRAWFTFPLYFGKLVKIGHSGSYDDPVEIVAIDGGCSFNAGVYTLYGLERWNCEVEESY